QSAMMVIRSIATGDLELKDFFRVMSKAFIMGLTLSIILGLMIFPIVLFLHQDDANRLQAAITIALALSIIILLSNLTGALLPLVLKSIRLDPALVSGPFISTLVDVGCLFLYFAIARQFIF
ncbi:magnesium transporter, partial [bacterium]|nr:magnesium transporter [bacterium]